jgi:hypothetical protein
MVRYSTETRECERACGEVVQLRVHGSVPRSRESWRLDAHRSSAKSDDPYIGQLFGLFAVFNTFAIIRGEGPSPFLEQIAPGAFTKTFRENRGGIKCMYQHGRDPVAGMNPIGPILELEEQGSVGARYVVGMLDSSWNRDRLPGLREGLYGASFRFQVVREEVNAHPGVSAHNPDGIEERRITEAKVREFGPVVWGAYETASANARSVDDVTGRILASRQQWDREHVSVRSVDELQRRRQPWRLPR